MFLPGIHLLEIGDELLGALNRWWGSQAHMLGDNTHELVAVIHSGVPDGRTSLQLPNERHNVPVLGLAQVDAVTGGNVLLLKVPIAGTCFGRDWQDMPHHPKLGPCSCRMEPSDFALHDLAARVQSPMRQERMTVAEGVPRAKLDKISIGGLLRHLTPGRLVSFFLRPRSRLLRLSGDFRR